MERFNPALTLTSSETAALLDVHASTVKRWSNDGDLSFDTTAGGHRRFHLEEVMGFARERAIPTVLTPFHPFEPHVWTALQEIHRDGSFRRLHSLAMSWVSRGQLGRLGLLYDMLARDPAIDLCAFCDDGVRGLMTRVGEAWAQGRLRVGDEHLVSQVVYESLVKVRPDLREAAIAARDGSPAPVAVVGTMEGNQHHLGSMCVRLVLEQRGWDVYYLGPDVPIEDFGVVQRGRSASLVCISLTPPAAAGDVARAVRILRGLYDPATPYALAFGGRVEGDVAPDLLSGPFEDVAIHRSCAGFAAALSARGVGREGGVE